MTHQRSNIFHRMIKARQAGPPGRPGGGGGGGAGGGSDDGNASSSADEPTLVPSLPSSSSSPPTISRSSTPPPAAPTTSDTPRPRPTSQTTTSSASPTTTDQVVQTTTSSTSTSSSETTTSSSSSSTDTTTSSTAPLSTITSTRGITVTSHLPTSARPVTRTSALSGLPDSTSSASPSPGSGVKAGSVIGGVVGVLVGLALLASIVAFFVRRWRRRRHRNTIIGDDDFRHSQHVVDNDNGPLEPPSMAQRHQSFTPSLASNPGMAGHGAYGAAAAMGAAGMGVAGAAANYGAMGHNGSNYGYAQDYQTTGRGGVDDDMSEHAHGIYSSEPQVQRPYNPEAYGSYAAYPTSVDPGQGSGYQEATRQYAPSFEPQYNQYVVTEPAPAVHAGPTPVVTVSTNNTTAQRDPASVSENRSANARSMVADEDVYGGI